MNEWIVPLRGLLCSPIIQQEEFGRTQVLFLRALWLKCYEVQDLDHFSLAWEEEMEGCKKQRPSGTL